jgi:hypothetical protein
MNDYLNKLLLLTTNEEIADEYIKLIEIGLSRGSIRSKVKKDITESIIERHHILPKSFKLGGEKDKANLVFLTAREHFNAHIFLSKMFSGIYHQKMCFALRRMAPKDNNKNLILSAEEYEYVKKVSGEATSEANKGHENYMINQTDEARKNISTGMKEMLSEMSKEELAERTKNSFSSPESWTDERKQKISDALTGIIRDEEFKDALRKNYVFISPSGEVFEHRGLKVGCEIHKLHHRSVQNVITIGRKYKGWKIYGK